MVVLGPGTMSHSLMIPLDAAFAQQIAPTGRILVLACVQGTEEEEMLAASLDFSVDGMFNNKVDTLTF